MTKVTKEITFDAAHMLADYDGKCRNLHGHTYRLQAEVTGVPDTSGMVTDFFELKRSMTDLVAGTFDHAYLYDATNPVESEIGSFLEARGLRTVPLPFKTTSENLARHIFTLLAKVLPVSAVRLWETPTSCAEYRP